jgi:hypothetical protein
MTLDQRSDSAWMTGTHPAFRHPHEADRVEAFSDVGQRHATHYFATTGRS